MTDGDKTGGSTGGDEVGDPFWVTYRDARVLGKVVWVVRRV